MFRMTTGVVLALVALLTGCSPGVETTGVDSIYALAARGDTPGVRQGLANGFEVNAQDAGGQTLLHHAIVGGHAPLVELLLLTYRANANLPDANGVTAVELALEAQNQAIIEVLYNEGLVTY